MIEPDRVSNVRLISTEIYSRVEAAINDAGLVAGTTVFGTLGSSLLLFVLHGHPLPYMATPSQKSRQN
jgi:hypothetical protein